MLRQYREQRHIDPDCGGCSLALEREDGQAVEVLAYDDGLNNRRVVFY